MRTIWMAALAACALVTRQAAAEVPMSGTFTASQACPALQSIRNQSNPGSVMVDPGQGYRVIAGNRPDATYVRIEIGGGQRWVSLDCGKVGSGQAGGGGPTTGDGGARATHVLAVGWEPAFCLAHRNTAECGSMTAQSPDANELSLHGLWPQPRGKAYCGVDPRLKQADRNHDWDSLPEPQLGPATRQKLAQIMPGLQSGLERHEWIVHGTCYGGPADAYFDRAATLAEQINASPVRDLFVGNRGGTLSADAIRAAFDQAFGAGAGARVTISCSSQGQGRVINELVIALAGDVTGSASLGNLILAAQPVPTSCPSGVVAQAAR